MSPPKFPPDRIDLTFRGDDPTLPWWDPLGGVPYIRADLVPKWQPIETAPEGEHVMGLWLESGGQAVVERLGDEWFDPHASKRTPHAQPPDYFHTLMKPPD